MRNRLQLVNTITNKQLAGQFGTRIDYIRFPLFRNLLPDTRIDFNFQLTAFVGLNGHGKSSTLHALYGCPTGYSVSKYWFSSEVDPIEESPRGPHCYIYNYPGAKAEVLKQRIHRKANPNYWETSRPLKKYNMTPLPKNARNPGIQMDVLYIDFRDILPAFDKYVHFERPKTKETYQYINERSKRLKKALREGFIYTRNKEPLNKEPKKLSPEAVQVCSHILGKDYTDITIIEHKFYKTWGFTVYFSDQHKYSEAVAGSGESAIVILVDKILSCKKNTLILLDEPEISLHPGAQSKLLDFFLDEILKNGHQIIFSTHSPSLIEGLPHNAVKLFRTNDDGFFTVEPEANPSIVFFELGATSPSTITIIVEDQLTQEIVDRVLKQLFGTEISNLVEIRYQPGGASQMKNNTANPHYRDNTYFLFDGDQKLCDPINPDTIPVEKSQDRSFLKRQIKAQLGQNINLQINSSVDLPSAQMQYLNFWYNNVKFMPFQDPETELWNNDLAISQLQSLGFEQNHVDSRLHYYNSLPSAKQKFAELTMDIMGNNSAHEIACIHTIAISKWLKNNTTNSYHKLASILKQIVEKP